MPLNLIQIRREITRLADAEAERQRRLPDGITAAIEALRRVSTRQETVRAGVIAAAGGKLRQRIGIPSGELVTDGFPVPTHTPSIELIAVDGSQIMLDPHANLQYGVINVASFRIPYGMQGHPSSERYSQIFQSDDYLSDDLINQERDYQERSLLADLCAKSSVPTVGLIDGGIEVWAGETGRGDGYKRWVRRHLKNLEKMSDAGAALGGYVDMPSSSPILRMLELAEAQRLIRSEELLKWKTILIRDRDLFGGFLSTGERSATFELCSPSSSQYTGDLALNFFYLNVGTNQRPVIARVEIPAWVARQKVILNRLHRTLIHQCHLVETIPYPYALARAHEEARLTGTDKRIVQDLINERLLAHRAIVEKLPAKLVYKQLL